MASNEPPPASTSPPDVTVVIPAYNCGDLLTQCLASLRASQGVAVDVVVVDNASPEDLSPVREQFPEVRWIRSETNLGYAAANNLGLQDAGGRYFCWLNSDAELPPNALAGMVEYLDSHPDAGAVTPRNQDLDGSTQPSLTPEHTLAMAWLRDSGPHLAFPNAPPFRNWLLPEFNWQRAQEVLTTQTTCLVIRREAYEQVGGMDPSLFLFYNDVDWCRRLRQAGWKLMYLPEPHVLHHGSASVETALWKERQLWQDRYRYFRKWYGLAGTLGVRSACISRGLWRSLAQVVKLRPAQLRKVVGISVALYRALDSTRNGA